ncbi:MAG: FAD-binding oxidoreductase [Pseudomonadota bacterium]
MGTSKVTHLPVDTGVSGWNAILPEQDPLVSLTTDTIADYLVIGGGFAGLSAARRLSQLKPDARIIILEAKRIAEGPAGRNSGFMIDLPHELSSTDYATTQDKDRNQIALNRQAIAFAADAAKEYGLTKEAYNPCGKINGAATERAAAYNASYASHLDQLNEPYELYDAARMQAITGSSFYKSGLFSPGTVMLQPALYVQGLSRGLANKVSCFEKSPVTSLDRLNGKWLAKTPHGSVSADKVILGVNGHIESFGRFERQVFHVMLYASMTRALTPEEASQTGEEIWGITPSDPMATTMRKISGSGGTRIVTRNRMSYVPTMAVSQDHVALMCKTHQASFEKRHLGLRGVEQEFSWAGRLCLSRNSAPAFGEVAEGLISACCQNGLGTTGGTLSGMAAAELAFEGETPLVQSMISKGKPRHLPPAPVDYFGATAFIRWGEFNARHEL